MVCKLLVLAYLLNFIARNRHDSPAIKKSSDMGMRYKIKALDLYKAIDLKLP
jgi:hypothetical protein